MHFVSGSAQVRISAGAFLGLLSSCSAEALPVFVPFPEIEARFGLYFAVDAAGTPLRQIGPTLAPRGGALDDEPNRVTLEEDEDELLFLGLDEAALDALAPLLDDSRASELSIRFGPFECGDRELDRDAKMLFTPIPESARFFRWRLDDAAFLPTELGAFDFLTSTTLAFPVDLERCRVGAPTELVPFGSTAELIPGDATANGLSVLSNPGLRELLAVVRLDDRRLVALGNDVVYLLEKDRPYADLPSQVVSLPIAYGQGVSMAIDRRSNLSARPIYVVGGPHRNPSAIHELSLSEEGLRFVRTTTTTDPTVNAVIVDSTGGVLAAGDDGTLWRRRAGNVESETSVLARRLQAVALSVDPQRPHLIAGTDLVFFGDAFTEEFETVSFEGIGIGSGELNAVGSRWVGDVVELWAAGKGGNIVRSLGTPFRPVHPDWDDVWLPCTSGGRACGLTPFSKLIDHLYIQGDWIYMRATNCDHAIIALNPVALCAAEIHAPRADEPVQILGIEVHDGWLTAVGNGGRVYELRL